MVKNANYDLVKKKSKKYHKKLDMTFEKYYPNSKVPWESPIFDLTLYF